MKSFIRLYLKRELLTLKIAYRKYIHIYIHIYVVCECSMWFRLMCWCGAFGSVIVWLCWCQERITAPIVLGLWLEGRWRWSLPVTRLLTSIVMIIVNTDHSLNIIYFPNITKSNLTSLKYFSLSSLLYPRFSIISALCLVSIGSISKNSDHKSCVGQSKPKLLCIVFEGVP